MTIIVSVPNCDPDKTDPKHFNYSLLWICILCFPETVLNNELGESSCLQPGDPQEEPARGTGQEAPQMHMG